MRIKEIFRRAVGSFLALPTGIIAIFVLLAVGSYTVEQADVGWLRPTRAFMHDHVFGDAEAASNLLGTIAGGLITITSITFSLLLLALQQSAASMTHQVFDQFLRRRLNQFYFGFFVGLALYALITLATVDPPFNPVLGATLALVLTMGALYLLLLLIYSTIGQMRPTEIMRSIHDHTLAARQRQLPIVQQTRRTSRLPAANVIPVLATRDGYVAGFDLDAIDAAIERASGPVEVVLLLPVGSFAAYQDPIAEVNAQRSEDAEHLAPLVEQATRLERARRLDTDPAFGIEQLETIAWRSISTSQQNPSPGLIAIRNLRDLLARWVVEAADEPAEERRAVIYPDDVMPRLMGALESLAVAASESMQHQTYAEIVRTFATTFARLPAPTRRRAEDVILSSLSALGDHVLTAELDEELTTLVQTLERAGSLTTATAVPAARTRLAASIGELNSRATRVPSAA